MLAVNPGVLLLDEPLSNLDARLRLEMRAELKRIHEEFKTTIVFVTHDQWEAMTLATTIAVMSEGTLQQMGTPNDIYDRPANRFVAEFVGSPPINILTFSGAAATGLAKEAQSYFAERYAGLQGIGSLGIRPESIKIVTDPAEIAEKNFSGPAEITGILPTGGSWIIEVRSAGDTVFMTTHESPEIEVGDKVHFSIKPSALHVFDAKGSRLADADAALRPKKIK
jgi:iron(III) transport system ATP-binding protein